MFKFLWSTTWGQALMTFLISMVPIIELRGAIPIGYAAGLNLWLAIPIAIIGNLIPIPFILIFIKKIFAWMRKVSPKLNGIVDKMEAKAEKNKAKILRHAFWGLVLFVAIPLPGTGAWTGALVAAMLDMPLKKAFPCIALGVLIAGALISFVTAVFGYAAAKMIFGL